MNAELVARYKCGICGREHRSDKAADLCCFGEKCPRCGKQRDVWFSELCRECYDDEHDELMAAKDRERWGSAKHVPVNEYDGAMIYCMPLERYYATSEFEEMVEEWTDAGNFGEFPPFVYGCNAYDLKLDADYIAQTLEESELAYDDYSVERPALNALKLLCDTWNSKYAETSYFPDYGIGIVSPTTKGADADAE